MRQRLTALLEGPHASGPSCPRATVQPDDLLFPIGVCGQLLYMLGRMRVQQMPRRRRPGAAAGGSRLLRLLAVPGPDLHRRGHYRFGRHQHPARQSAAGRDPAAADLPAATGTTAGSGTSAPTTASCTRSACRASTGLPNPPLQTWKPSWPGRPGSRFHCPGHAIRRPHPEGMDVLF